MFRLSTLMPRGFVNPERAARGAAGLLCCAALSFAAAVPHIDFVQPPSALPGSGTLALTIHGANFADSSTVQFGGVNLVPTSRTPGRLTVNVPAASLSAARTSQITVDGVSNPVSFPVHTPSTTVAVASVSFPAQYAVAVASADFNGDHIADLVLVNWCGPLYSGCVGGSIDILLGDGTGKFEAHASLPAADWPTAMTLGDFNEDGKTDIVTVGNEDTVRVLTGDGTGSFSATTFLVGEGPPAQSLAAVVSGDFDGDGHLDLIVGGTANGPLLLAGDGTGHFRDGMTLPGGTGARSIALGDFNSDGKLDLAICGIESEALRILTGDGSGHFSVSTIEQSEGSRQVSTGDLNADGKLDLIVAADSIAGEAQFWLGDGAGHFSSPLTSILAAGDLPVVGDFDNDGLTDVILKDQLVTLRGGSLSAARVEGVPNLGAGTNQKAAGDFNLDGRLDLAFIAINARSVTIMTQTDFVPPPVTYSVNEVCYPRWCIANVLGDGGVVAGTNFAIFPDTGYINVLEKTGYYFYPSWANSSNVIVGYSAPSQSSVPPQAMVWLPDSANLLNLTPVFGWESGTATYINNKNEVVGYPFSGAPVSDLVPGVTFAQVYGMTESHIVIGTDSGGGLVYRPGDPVYRFPYVNLSHAFNSAGQVLATFPFLGQLLTPGVGYTAQESQPEFRVVGFNDAGQFLGNKAAVGGYVPSVWTAAKGLVPVSSLIPGNTGWKLVNAIAINNGGQMLISGVRDGYVCATPLLITPQGAAERSITLSGGAKPGGLPSAPVVALTNAPRLAADCTTGP